MRWRTVVAEPPGARMTTLTRRYFAVEGWVGRRIPEHVLLAKLRADARANTRKLVERIDGKVFPPVSRARSARSEGPLRSSGGRMGDSLDLHVGLAHFLFDLRLGRPAVIVPAVG